MVIPVPAHAHRPLRVGRARRDGGRPLPERLRRSSAGPAACASQEAGRWLIGYATYQRTPQRTIFRSKCSYQEEGRDHSNQKREIGSRQIHEFEPLADYRQER